MADKKVGWVGTGVMGRSMCLHLIEAGYETAVYTRSRGARRRPGGGRRRLVRRTGRGRRVLRRGVRDRRLPQRRGAGVSG